jgi:hypothetical protein
MRDGCIRLLHLLKVALQHVNVALSMRYNDTNLVVMLACTPNELDQIVFPLYQARMKPLLATISVIADRVFLLCERRYFLFLHNLPL